MYNILHIKITTLPKGTIIDTINLQPGQLIHMKFYAYNVIFICGLTSMLTFVCKKTITLWVLLTASKRYPVRII